MLAATNGRAAPPAASVNPCEQAAATIEKLVGLPEGVLLAIGRVESGRFDPAVGRIAPWPWALNVEGEGHWYESLEEASAALKSFLEKGIRSIDVGCFQINLEQHPRAFPDPPKGFDPDTNARQAAIFLAQNYVRTGEWEEAVALYHSANQLRGQAYTQQVLAAWSAIQNSGAARLAAAVPPRPAPAPAPVEPAIPTVTTFVEAGVRVFMPSVPGGGSKMVAMPPAAANGPVVIPIR